MAMVHVVHPVYYKVRKDTLTIGSSDEFKEVGESISYFLNFALNHKIQILHHRDSNPKFVQGIIQNIAIQSDPYLNSILDPRIDWIVTTQYGIPVTDEKPDGLSDDEWYSLQMVYTTRSQLRKKLGKTKHHFYIGGMFEACLGNAIIYHRRNYEGKVYLISDLLVHHDNEKRIRREREMHEYDVEIVSSDTAIEFLKNIKQEV